MPEHPRTRNVDDFPPLWKTSVIHRYALSFNDHILDPDRFLACFPTNFDVTQILQGLWLLPFQTDWLFLFPWMFLVSDFFFLNRGFNLCTWVALFTATLWTGNFITQSQTGSALYVVAQPPITLITPNISSPSNIAFNELRVTFGSETLRRTFYQKAELYYSRCVFPAVPFKYWITANSL